MDRLAFYFLVVGSLGTLVVGMLMASLVSIYALIGLVAFFIITLAAVYYRNYRQQQILQQSMVLNIAILIYLAN
jgi:membrane protein implicated in regulation of membrane protease activity